MPVRARLICCPIWIIIYSFVLASLICKQGRRNVGCGEVNLTGTVVITGAEV